MLRGAFEMTKPAAASATAQRGNSPTPGTPRSASVRSDSGTSATHNDALTVTQTTRLAWKGNRLKLANRGKAVGGFKGGKG